MTNREAVLGFLHEKAGTPVSGADIAQALGISRTSVWKAVESLRQEGYLIDAAPHRGYRLHVESDVLTAAGIRQYLGEAAARFSIQVEDQVTSTNTVLKELAEAGAPEGTVLIARRQTAGKGRLGRTFHSPQDTGLYMSVLLRPDGVAEASLHITTAAAVAVCRAIEEVTGISAAIKWVNDVYVHGKKVCGILTEASVDFETGGLHYAVLGMGINVSEPPGGFSEELRRMATSLYEREPAQEVRAQLAAAVLRQFGAIYREMADRAFMEEYRRRSFLTGMRITFVQGNLRHEGVVQGIDGTAALLVQGSDGTVSRYTAGEIQIDKSFLEQTDSWLHMEEAQAAQRRCPGTNIR